MPFGVKTDVSKEDILAAIKDCAQKLGRAPTTRELEEMTERKIDRALVNRRLANYTHALELCGLTREDSAKPRPMPELFLAWATLARKLKKLPTYSEFNPETGISPHCLMRRFRKWSLIGKGMLRYMEQEHLEGEWADVAELIRQEIPALPVAPAIVLPLEHEQGKARSQARTKAPMFDDGLEPAPVLSDRPCYGKPIHHPAMANAPINEMGVLGLFMAMAVELGFMVTRIQAGFPDVEAYRKTEGGRWQRVLIELEFESRTFVEHRHDLKDCDLIVCWVHNWKECPVPVIELSRFFRS